ncbi:MAG TPA: branched-chain amino acid ABC transporter permease [Firmicutes bacterium]|nr:branched-chain amino acid ABC transporter permease [Bacillota bacterium]
MMLAAYLGYFSCILIPSFSLGLLVAVVGGGLVSSLMEFFGYRFLRQKKIAKIYYLALSMGFCTFFENLVINVIGPLFLVYPPVLRTTPIPIGGLSMGVPDLLALVLTMAFLVVFSYGIQNTMEGAAIRAASGNLEATELMGVNLNVLLGLIFFIAGGAAGLAGVILGIKYTVYPQMWYMTNKVFIATVFGGLGSLAGAVVASLGVGLLETFVTAYVSSEASNLVVFLLLILVLLFRPQGLLGKQVEEKA